MGQVSKLNFVDNKLGAGMPGQQTTRIIFDTVIPQTQTNRLEFFKNFQNKTLGQTNLTTNKLDASESMVIKSIWLWSAIGEDNYGLPFGTGNPAAPVPPQTLDIFVGNQKVIKALPIHFNGNGDAFDRLHVFNGGQISNLEAPGPGSGSRLQQVSPIEIRLLTDIVLPPQVNFSVIVNHAQTGELYGSAVTPGQYGYVCALSGYGKIFSAGSSF